MKKLLDNITAEVTKAFVEAGYEEKFGKVTLSNRPDLCEFQCNGAMAAAKQYKKAPFMIADDVAARLQGQEMFASVESVKPGFLNLKLSEEYLQSIFVRCRQMSVTVARRLPSQRRSSWITAEPMWQNHCMWDIFVPLLSVRV